MHSPAECPASVSKLGLLLLLLLLYLSGSHARQHAKPHLTAQIAAAVAAFTCGQYPKPCELCSKHHRALSNLDVQVTILQQHKVMSSGSRTTQDGEMRSTSDAGHT